MPDQNRTDTDRRKSGVEFISVKLPHRIGRL